MPRDHPVWRSEIFGPALAVRTFTTEAEALELADDSDYGLVATVVSGDVGHAERIAARIDAGACLDQFGPGHLPQHRLGRLQGERHRPRARPLGAQRLSRRQAPDHRRAGAAVKVAVIGAGVVGVATAYALARDGHEVVVVERRERAAMESSYGNAGLYSPSDSYAWASPDALKMAVRSLFNRDLGIQYKLRLDPALWLWSLKFLGQCTDAAARRNSLLKLRLDLLFAGAARGGRAGDGHRLRQSPRGAALLFRQAGRRWPPPTTIWDCCATMASTFGRWIATASSRPSPASPRSRTRSRAPSIRPIARPAAAICSPTRSRSGARSTAAPSSASARRLSRLRRDGDRITGLDTDRGGLVADAYVLASGADCVFLARDAGLALPIYPVKGFSITAEVKDPAVGPKMGVVDEDRLVAMSRPGDRLRAASSAVFTGLRPKPPAGGFPGDPCRWCRASTATRSISTGRSTGAAFAR